MYMYVYIHCITHNIVNTYIHVHVYIIPKHTFFHVCSPFIIHKSLRVPVLLSRPAIITTTGCW